MTPTKPEASAPVVTRADREAALKCLGFEWWAQANRHPRLGKFVEGTYEYGPHDSKTLVALAIATARHEAEARGYERGRVEERKVVVAWLRSVCAVMGVTPEQWPVADRVLKIVARNIEAGEHIAKEGT